MVLENSPPCQDSSRRQSYPDTPTEFIPFSSESNPYLCPEPDALG